jgi:thioredoxin reductase (NADPH)
VARDRSGFVLTGPDVPRDEVAADTAAPLLLETSMPGVFAAGDVRHGSVKRVATAVGEGAIVVQLVHRYLDGESNRPGVGAGVKLAPGRKRSHWHR